MAREKFTTVQEYLSDLPKESKALLNEIRTTVKKIIPRAEEVISYNIPAFRLDGTVVVFYAAFTRHVSIYPVPKGAGKAITAYQAGKGTLQFPLDEPLPLKIITQVVKMRMKENEERALAKAKKKK